MNILHVFLDTNILYSDPYFKYQNKILIDFAAKGKIKLVISTVVYSELLALQQARIKQHITELKSGYNALKKITPIELDLNEVTRDTFMDHLKQFYENLKKEGLIQIIEPTKDIFAIILDNSLNKEAPFFNNKNEFKDSVIWHNYVDFIKKENIRDRCILTENKRDFCNKDGVLHPTLSAMINIKHYLNVENFIISEAVNLELTPSENILKLMDRITKTNGVQYIFDLLNSHRDKVELALDVELQNFESSFGIRNKFPNTIISYKEFEDWRLLEVPEINLEAIDDQLHVKAVISMKIEFNLYEQIVSTDELDYIAAIEPVIKFNLSLYLDEKGDVDFLELDTAEIENF